MAAFSYQLHQPSFLIDPFFMSNTKQPYGFMMDHHHEEEANIHSNYFSQFYSNENSFIDHDSSKLAVSDDNNETSVTKKQSTDDYSSIVDKVESGDQVTQNVNSVDKKRRITRNESTLSSAQSKDAREGKNKKQKKCGGEKEKKEGKSTKKLCDQEPPIGYIHVRARRGQATDSHSLAERVRREKISERMKVLQRLVPGCDKVTGKAVMLDEIINYVQSLQNQVEFLSMKLASTNPLFYDFGGGMDLDAYIIRPERFNGMDITTMPSVQQCGPTSQQQQTMALDADATTTTSNNYPGLDGSPSGLIQQHQRPNALIPQVNSNVMWEIEEERQKYLNQSGFTNNLCSYH